MISVTRSARRLFIILRGKLPLDEDCVKRHAVSGREYLRPHDVGARRGAGAGYERQQARMIRRIDCQLGDGGERIGMNFRHDVSGRRTCSISA